MFEKFGYNSIEIFLESEPSVLFERYKKRWDSGERHRGHVDHERFEEFQHKLMNDTLMPLEISDKIIRINTTDFNNVNYDLLKNNLLSLICAQ